MRYSKPSLYPQGEARLLIRKFNKHGIMSMDKQEKKLFMLRKKARKLSSPKE